MIKSYGILAPILGTVISIFLFLDLSSTINAKIYVYAFNTVYLAGYYYVIITIQGVVLTILVTLITQGTGQYLFGMAESKVSNDTVSKITYIYKTLSRQ